jgi:cellulose synthase/poly-beta-1,6-N-acetylglucosamine synthase-like glycosyltransferase
MDVPLWLVAVLGVWWLAWAVQSWLAAWQVRKFAGFLRRAADPRPAHEGFRPFARVIVPVRGLDPDLPAAVSRLCRQRYPAYRLVFVADDEADPAVAVLRRQSAQHAGASVAVWIAGPAGAREGQKVHNQLYALRRLEAEDRPQDQDVWVFADSDAVPDEDWLGNLVGPLAEGWRTAVSTGYRWLVPEPDAPVWSHLASVINSSVASYCGRGRTNRAWGGSMAMRVSTARAGNLVGRLTGAVTDDYPVTRLARELDREVYFARRCLVASPTTMTLPQLVNFGHRQYLITRVYDPTAYAFALSTLTLWCLGFVTAWAALLATVIMGGPAWTIAGPVAAIALVACANQVRANLRRRIIRQAFGPDMLKTLRTTLQFDRWATPVWMGLHWMLVVRGGIGCTMVWRGIRYRLRGPNDVERLH